MMNVGGGKAPITIGINPTIAFYSIILGGACALAAYTEKYRRDQDEIDDRLKERYFTNIKEQQAKMPLITQTIRGQDARLDDAMNKWVWGGKADLSESTTTTMAATTATSSISSSGGGGGGGGGNTSKPALVAQSSNEEDEPSSSSSEEDELDSSSSSSSSDSSDSDSSSISEEEREQEKKLSKKERRQRRKERKQRREARRKKREEEKRRLEVERQKLVYQSVAAGVAVGAVAVAITMVVGNRRN